MNELIWFIIGFIVGFGVFWTYSWITDKLNILKLTYKGGWFIYDNFIKNKIK